MQVTLRVGEAVDITAEGVRGTIIVTNHGDKAEVAGYDHGALRHISNYPLARPDAQQAVGETILVPDFKAISNELFDMLTEVNDRLQRGLMGEISGRLVTAIPELLERFECEVKDK